MPLRPALHRLSSLKTVALAGATALLLPVAAQAQQIYINTPVQLFAGPDTSYPVVAMLYPGLDVRVIGCLPSYEWCDILLSDGMRGWVFGESLSYPWRGNPLPVPQYGTTIGIPLITFSIGEYWGSHYRHQPWFDDYRWRRPPPQPRVMPAPPPSGWQQPFPPHRDDRDDRYDRERHFQPDRDRNFRPDMDRPFPPRQERGAPPQTQQAPPQHPQRPEQNRGAPNVAPMPAPPVSSGNVFQPRPERDRAFPPGGDRQAPPRQERFEAPRPNLPPPQMNPAPAGNFNQGAQQRMEAPMPQRQIALPPDRERNRGGSDGRMEGPRGNP